MKKLILSVLLALIPIVGFAQVRSSVCIVRPNYSQEIVDLLYTMVPKLKRLGVENPSKYLENFISYGSSGSGFVYVAPDGKNYVITNRHVISDAETVTVVFQDEKGKNNVEYKKLTLVDANDELDLAVLAFPNDERPLKKGLEFISDELATGTAIYTAGYPGLLGYPSWQFGSGIVTNSNVEQEAMIKPELSYVIQHSAQIDGGNSGGPLLIKDISGEYKIAGVNTWKLYNRQDVNFAIPTSTVKKYIDDVLNVRNSFAIDRDSSIIEKSEDIHKIVNKYNISFEDLLEYISIDYVEAEGKEIFERAINQASAENIKTLNYVLTYSPILSIKYTIAWYIFMEYHKNEYYTDGSKKSSVKEAELPKINSPIQNEGTNTWYTRLYNGYTKRVGHIDWVYSNGGWQILKFTSDYSRKIDKTSAKSRNNKIDNDEETENDEEDFKLDNPFLIQVSYGKNLLNLYEVNSVFNHVAKVSVNCLDMLAVNLSTEIQENVHTITQNGTKTNPIKSITPVVGAQFQVPLPFSICVFMPYVNLSGGVTISNLDSPEVEFTTLGELGYRFYFSFAKDSFGAYIDVCSRFGLEFNKFRIVNSPLCVSFGVAF